MSDPAETQRIDKWLWHARFFKTRSLAADVVKSGRVRLDGARVSKASTLVKPDHVLTFSQADQIRIVKVLAIGARRGPATEAATLYEDLTPAQDKPSKASKPPQRDRRAAAKAKRALPT